MASAQDGKWEKYSEMVRMASEGETDDLIQELITASSFAQTWASDAAKENRYREANVAALVHDLYGFLSLIVTAMWGPPSGDRGDQT